MKLVIAITLMVIGISGVIYAFYKESDKGFPTNSFMAALCGAFFGIGWFILMMSLF